MNIQSPKSRTVRINISCLGPNIAEGAVGRSSVQFRNYLSVALGFLNELATQLEKAHRIGYLDSTAFADTESLVDECLAVTYGLRKTLR